MIEVETGRFTVAVFQDVTWASKGLEALKKSGFPSESLSILAKESPDVGALIESTLGSFGERIELARIGAVLASGPLVDALQSQAKDLAAVGLAASIRRVGFQSHDGHIFETLTDRGGVL